MSDGGGLKGYVRWMASLAIGYLPWMLGRWFAHGRALLAWHTAGECRACRANLTWRIGGPRPSQCPICGIAEPCYETDYPGSVP